MEPGTVQSLIKGNSNFRASAAETSEEMCEFTNVYNLQRKRSIPRICDRLNVNIRWFYTTDLYVFLLCDSFFRTRISSDGESGFCQFSFRGPNNKRRIYHVNCKESPAFTTFYGYFAQKSLCFSTLASPTFCQHVHTGYQQDMYTLC